MDKNRDRNGKFVIGNKASKKLDRICANHPFCKERINTKKYPNMRYCCPTCKIYAHKYRIANNLIKKG